MLRRLNVRTRLVAVIAVPLVLLLAVAVPEALQRRERATDAGRAAAASGDVTVLAAAIETLQAERTLSAALRSGGDADAALALSEQRARTDTAVVPVGAALDRLAFLDRATAAAVDSARTRLGQLDNVRDETDASESLVPWTDPFAPALDALLQVQEAVGAAVADLGVGSQVSLVALVAQVKESTAAQATQMAATTIWGELRGDQEGILTDQRAAEVAYRTAYLAASPSAERTDRRAALLAGDATNAGRAVDEVVEGEAVGTLDQWLDLSAGRQLVFREVEASRAGEAVRAAEDIEASSSRSSTAYLALAGTGLLLALALAVLAARSITRPLRELTEAADHLARERLPQLVDALRHPVDDDEHYLTAALEPIEVRADDELGHLARAFDAVQSVAVDVAAEQAALLKKGISDLYVNLARRNQALIDRQIQLLDELEAEEQDTQVLEHLYLLDHLATRMRRNAESLLILAGSESGPRRSKPIDLVDVVRAALSEVEEYERVDLGTLAAATLHGPAVSDVAHLVAELLENATQFSPPHTMVRVDGARVGGSYQIVITDRGVGMREEQLDELNAILRDPPVTGLALGRSLGCLVAARLAARHGITVRLRPGDDEGMAAYVVVPRHLLVEDPAPLPAAPAPAPALERPAVADECEADWPPHPEPEPLLEPATRDQPEPAVAPARLRDALPAGAAFEAGIQAILDEGRDPSRPEPTLAEEVAGLATTLQRRIPGATAESLPTPINAAPVRRSPDEVRALLSRYRSGLEAGRGGDGPADEERS